MPGTSLLPPRWRMHAAHMRPTVSSGLNMTASKIQRINIIRIWFMFARFAVELSQFKLGTVDPNDLGSVDIKVIWPIWLGVEDPIRELVSIWLMLSTSLLLFVTPISFDCVGCLEDGQSLLSSSGTSSRFDFRMFLSLIALICKIWRRNAAADAWASFQSSICAAKSSFRESIRCHRSNMDHAAALSGHALHGHVPGNCSKFGEAQEASCLPELN